jgi:hypothetical protein
VRDVSGDIGVKELRNIERTAAGTITDQVTGQQRRVWEVKDGRAERSRGASSGG